MQNDTEGKNRDDDVVSVRRMDPISSEVQWDYKRKKIVTN